MEPTKNPSPMSIMLDPKKYGYEECRHCNGYGSSIKDPGNGRCSRCGGLGLVRVKEQQQ